ncbi:MAG: zinc-ribbon domain-containing protein [Desulfatiglans sp.]|jgi:rubrerythrin|nr:zinc-ribbon domain-containing protein [Desulfatiglans sp.]
MINKINNYNHIDVMHPQGLLKKANQTKNNSTINNHAIYDKVTITGKAKEKVTYSRPKAAAPVFESQIGVISTCTQCGTSIKSLAAFCPHCGTKIT